MAAGSILGERGEDQVLRSSARRSSGGKGKKEEAEDQGDREGESRTGTTNSEAKGGETN